MSIGLRLLNKTCKNTKNNVKLADKRCESRVQLTQITYLYFPGFNYFLNLRIKSKVDHVSSVLLIRQQSGSKPNLILTKLLNNNELQHKGRPTYVSVKLMKTINQLLDRSRPRVNFTKPFNEQLFQQFPLYEK